MLAIVDAVHEGDSAQGLELELRNVRVQVTQISQLHRLQTAHPCFAQPTFVLCCLACQDCRLDIGY